MVRQRTRRGRPPLHRDRTDFKFTLERPALDDLAEQAESIGFPMGSYLERVVCLAHGFSSPYLPPLVHPLPIRVPLTELTEHVDQITRDECGPVLPGEVKLQRVRLDDALAERIYDWCDERDVPYAGYLRSIMRLAAGYRSLDELRPAHFQPELLAEDQDYRGEHARAS